MSDIEIKPVDVARVILSKHARARRQKALRGKADVVKYAQYWLKGFEKRAIDQNFLSRISSIFGQQNPGAGQLAQGRPRIPLSVTPAARPATPAAALTPSVYSGMAAMPAPGVASRQLNRQFGRQIGATVGGARQPSGLENTLRNAYNWWRRKF